LASVSDALPSAADLQLLDPAFWDMLWNALLDPNAGESPWLLQRVLSKNFPSSVRLWSSSGLPYFR
jgi:hypothetical protein